MTTTQSDVTAKAGYRVPFGTVSITNEARQLIDRILETKWVTKGKYVQEFEEGFARLFGTKYAVALSSGTDADALALATLYDFGARRGDEVIVPALSFVATGNAVLQAGFNQVFVDVQKETLNIDPAKIVAAIGPRTRAIIAVDLYGQAYDHDAVAEIAGRHRLVVIEDACQAIGAEYKGKPAGSLGDFGCFSLYATKNAIAGEGGILATNSAAADRSARAFRHHGMVAPYEYDGLGYNYRLTDIAAAIGCEQLKKLRRFCGARQNNARRLTEGLSEITGLVLPRAEEGRTHTFNQYTVRVTKEFGVNRDELAERLKSAGIGSAIYYPKPLHVHAHLAADRYKIGDFPVAEQAAAEVLSLPVHPGLARDDVDKIVRAVKWAAS